MSTLVETIRLVGWVAAAFGAVFSLIWTTVLGLALVLVAVQARQP